MCQGMPCKRDYTGGDRAMKQKKKWYDYLWIFSLTYLILGFFNILFAWLGLLCFFIPLIISVVKGSKSYCNKFCGRGQLFSLIGGKFGLSRKKDIPKWMKSKYFRYGFLIFFFADRLNLQIRRPVCLACSCPDLVPVSGADRLRNPILQQRTNSHLCKVKGKPE